MVVKGKGAYARESEGIMMKHMMYTSQEEICFGCFRRTCMAF